MNIKFIFKRIALISTALFLGGAILYAESSSTKNDDCGCGDSVLPAELNEWKITGSDFAHDPSVIFAQGKYWMFYTADGIGFKSSQDGRHWEQEIPVFGNELKWWKKYVPAKSDFNIWAPEIVYFNKKYYLYYSVSTFGSRVSAIGLATCTDLEKADWKDLGLVINSVDLSDYNCIDPSFVCDGKNQYLVFGSWSYGIYVVQLNPKTMKPMKGATPEKIANRTSYPPTNAIEGPCIWHAPDGYFYLFASYDKCCSGVDSTYNVRVGRAEKVLGPYFDRDGNEMLSDGGTTILATNGRQIGPGGQCIFKTEKGLYAIGYHFYDRDKDGKATFAAHDIAIVDGWPSLELE